MPPCMAFFILRLRANFPRLEFIALFYQTCDRPAVQWVVAMSLGVLPFASELFLRFNFVPWSESGTFRANPLLVLRGSCDPGRISPDAAGVSG